MYFIFFIDCKKNLLQRKSILIFLSIYFTTLLRKNAYKTIFSILIERHQSHKTSFTIDVVKVIRLSNVWLFTPFLYRQKCDYKKLNSNQRKHFFIENSMERSRFSFLIRHISVQFNQPRTSKSQDFNQRILISNFDKEYVGLVKPSLVGLTKGNWLNQIYCAYFKRWEWRKNAGIRTR